MTSKLRILRHRPVRLPSSTVLVTALACLLVSAGSATAGALVTGASIKDGSVSTLDIRNGSLGRLDLSPAARVPNTVVRSTTDMGFGPVTAHCLPGERATGGGGVVMGMHLSRPEVDDAGNPVGWTVAGTAPQGWTGVHTDPDGATWVEDPAASAYVVCARA